MAGYVVCYTDDDGYREVVASFTEPRDAHILKEQLQESIDADEDEDHEGLRVIVVEER
jgi:hypothetical protein